MSPVRFDEIEKADAAYFDSHPILSAVFTPDGKRIAVGTSKGDVLLFDKTTRNIVQQVHTGSSGVKELSFDRSGRCVLYLAFNKSCKIDWSLPLLIAHWLLIPTIESYVCSQSLQVKRMEMKPSVSLLSIAFKTLSIERHG